MKKAYLPGIVVILIVAVAAIFYYGQSPSPEGLIDATVTESPREIGVSIYTELNGKLAGENLIAFGVSPTDVSHQQIAEAFIASAALEKKPFEIVFQEPGLPPLNVPEGTEVVPIYFNSEIPELVAKIKEKTASGKRAFIYTVNLYSSHTLDANPIRRFEQQYGKMIPAVSTIAIGLVREQEFKVDPPCIGSERDGQGTAKLGCAALHKQRSLYRRKMDTEKLISMMDERSAGDYLVYVYTPAKKIQ